MSSLNKLLGNNIINKNKDIVNTNELMNNDVIALYFSAHWCGPCKQFTPQFSTSYKLLKNENKKFEVIFISSDRDEKSFNEYYNEMPWLAIDYKDRERKNKLSKKYKIQGIPSVVLINGQGELISKNGRNMVTNIDEFPWPQPKIEDLLTNLQTHDGSTTFNDVKDKYIGLYFSAHWCPPCKMFTPQLAKMYKLIKSTRNDFEIIFISSDRDEKSFNEYYNEMPFFALPYELRDIKDKLSNYFEVNGIPTFVMLDKNLKILNPNARSAVTSDPEGKDFPWAPKAVNNMDSPDGVNESASLIVLVEKESKEKQNEIEKTLFKIAKSQNDDNKDNNNNDDDDDDEKLLFFIGTNSEGVSNRIRQLTKVTDSIAMLILDIPDNGGYYVSKESPTEENISKFMKEYKAGNLERLQLS